MTSAGVFSDPIASGIDQLPPAADRDVQRTLAVIAGIAALSGPRRTRPLAGFLYGAFLSRAQGSSTRGLSDAMRRRVGRIEDEQQLVARCLHGPGAICGRLHALEERLHALASNVGAFDRDHLRRVREAEKRIGVCEARLNQLPSLSPVAQPDPAMDSGAAG